MTKYQAYELVQVDERVILNIQAPGVTVYLADEVDALIVRLMTELTEAPYE